jgi:hypothetical protein
VGLQLLLSGVSTPDRTVGADPAPTETTDEATQEETTPPEEDEETPEDTEEPDETTISLTADPTSVAASQRITLSGALEPAVEGVLLRVERRLGDDDDWSGFPDSNNPVTTTTRSDGEFSTWVQTGRTGENEWRLVTEIDGEEIVSSTATVTVN